MSFVPTPPLRRSSRIAHGTQPPDLVVRWKLAGERRGCGGSRNARRADHGRHRRSIAPKKPSLGISRSAAGHLFDRLVRAKDRLAKRPGRFGRDALDADVQRVHVATASASTR